MDNRFFEHPVLNSPYAYPVRHWELDDQGQPTQRLIETRRRAEFITPIPKPRKRSGKATQQQIVFNEGKGLSTEEQQYDPTSIINELRYHVAKWRNWPNPNEWQVTPETARLLQHWRHHKFNSIRPFFCQIEAVETAIWLTEVAPKAGKAGKGFLDHLANANHGANPELMRLALKLATADQPGRPKPVIDRVASVPLRPVATVAPQPADPAGAIDTPVPDANASYGRTGAAGIEKAAAGLIEAGLKFLESITGDGASSAEASGGRFEQMLSSLFTREPGTNRPMLSMPRPESLNQQRVAAAISGLVNTVARAVSAGK